MLSPGRLDWRWHLAADASGFCVTEALYQLRSQDCMVLAAHDFKRALDDGLGIQKWLPQAAAYELYTTRDRERLFIEGMLLSGADNKTIAYSAACDEEDVQAYHDLFFDVRPRLDKAGWVVAQLFGGSLYGAMNPRDKVGLLHRVAWLGGKDVFLSYYTGKTDKKLADRQQSILRDMVAKQSLLASMCLVGRDEINIDLVRVFLDTTQEEVARTMGGGDEAFAASVLTFVRSVNPLVADPTDPNNLILPAREKRPHEYLEAPANVDQTNV